MSVELEDFPEFIVRLELGFKAIRVVGSRLVPTTWKLLAEVYYDEDRDDDDALYDVEIQTVTSKIKYWFEHYLNGSLIFDAGNEWAAMAFFDENGAKSVNNNIVVMPLAPTDDLIAEIIHSKINAFGGKVLQFGTIELSSDDATGLTYLFTGEGEQNLPTMDEWVGPHAYYDKPWWARPDASTYDVLPAEDADLSNPPVPAETLDFIRQHFLKQSGHSAEVIRPQFKPVIVNGDKSDS